MLRCTYNAWLAMIICLLVQTVVRGWQLGTQPHVRGATSELFLYNKRSEQSNANNAVAYVASCESRHVVGQRRSPN
jgi:hypothetical protein